MLIRRIKNKLYLPKKSQKIESRVVSIDNEKDNIILNDDKQDKLESPVISEISENNSDIVSDEKATKKRKKKK